MSSISFFFVLFFYFTNSQQCVYDVISFVGETILPTDAINQIGSFPEIDDYCSTNDAINWAEGLENALDTVGPPEIDYDFFYCKTGLYMEGYVLLDSDTGLDLDSSKGVTVGGGIDLAAFSRTELASFGVSTSILDTVNTFINPTLTGFLAADSLCTNGPVEILQQEMLDITNAVIDNYYIPTVRNEYNNNRDNETTTPWNELALCYRTVITYLFYENSNLFDLAIWTNILENDWSSVITELRAWTCYISLSYCVPLEIRYYQLSNILETCEPCGNQIDLVFLVDASGSVSQPDFDESLQFIATVVNSTANGTQVGLSQFASSYRTEFTMNMHNLNTAGGRSAAMTDILNTVKYSGGTALAAALSELALTQFSDGSGVRDTSELVPRVAIVLTDGISFDDPSTTVGELADLGVTVMAIGIGGYSASQLLDIVNDDDRYVFFLDDFDELVLILDRISIISCDVSAESNPDGAYSEVVEATVGVIQRYRISLPFRRRLQGSDSVKIEIRQTQGCVYVYHSYCNQYPDQFNNDFAHEACDVANKTLIVPYTTDIIASLPCTPTAVNFAVEGIDASINNQYQVASSFCSSADEDCQPGVNYIYDFEVNQTLSDDIIVLNSDKECISVVSESIINPDVCTNRTNERDCLGYFGYCNYIDFVTNNPTTIPSTNPTAEPSINPTLNPSINPTQQPTMNPNLCEGRCWTAGSSVCSCSLDCKRPSGDYCCEDYEDVCIENLSTKCQRRYESAYDDLVNCYNRKNKKKWACNNDFQMTLVTLAARCNIPTDGMGGGSN